jgi:hypothetical protein
MLAGKVAIRYSPSAVGCAFGAAKDKQPTTENTESTEI